VSKKKTTKTAKAGKTAKAAKTQTREIKGAHKKVKPTTKAAKMPAVPASVPPKPIKVNITAAKGRPMLTWVGKRPLAHVMAFPAQLVEHHNALKIVGIDPDVKDAKTQLVRDLRSQCNEKCWKGTPFIGTRTSEVGGLLLHGDNKDVLACLLLDGFRGGVKCIYIDPPFDSGADYVRQIRLRGARGNAKISGESYALGEQVQYEDIWVNDNYLQFMYDRVILLKELLHEDGSLALHCDAKRSHYIRLLLDEVFGPDNFRAEIVVRAGVKNVQAQFEQMSNLTLGSNSIFLYSKSTDTKYRRLQKLADKYEPGKWDTFWRGTNRPTMRYELFGQKPEHGQWRWKETRARIAVEAYEAFLKTDQALRELKDADLRVRLDAYYLLHLKGGKDFDFVRPSSEGVVQYYVPPRKYKLLSSIWFDLPYRGTETDYPTEKNEAIAERIVSWITDPGDLVMDCFAGSGTVISVAQKVGRRWIGCDINKGAIQTTVKRLRSIIVEQIQTARLAAAEARQGKLIKTTADDEPPPPKPCAFEFSVWRVNDYDLQIQHNEAVNLACEHIGIQRTRSDSYFEGTLGKKLVKIIPLGHPLTPLDLEELKRELDSRPDEDRNIVVVCLGMELATKTWIDAWNRMRKGRDAVNKIDVIELRTDSKYGGFIKHEPAAASVNVTRTNRGDEAQIVIEVQDFISPTIVERLREQAGLLSPKIDDWRAMVDCIYIDTAYNGSVLNITLDDVPERKADFVVGRYELPAPADETLVAVKIVDMLGEEVLVTKVV